jgi:choline dehydrogenase-like flavoprotein
MTDLVIGSGPSGVAVATALLQRGRTVVMLDGGRTLETDRAAARERLAARPPEDWSAADRAAWQAPQFDAEPGRARRYGSDFAMEPAEATFSAGADRFALRASRATGGLSNLWGSAILPYRAADMAGWPIGEADLAPHYRAIAQFLPISGMADALQAEFPALPMNGRAPLPAGPQGAALVSRLCSRGLGSGITAGASRQAVASGCRACGQCLHGCPWELIWSARRQVETLRAHENFTHRPGAIVTAFEEAADGVTLHLASGETLSATRAFLAAGVLETARILLASQPARGPVTLRDSQHGFLPSLRLWRSPRPDRGLFHTLTQAFVELDAPDLSPFLIHAQLYGWNEFYERDLIATYGRRLPGSAPLWRALARRLIVAQIFLHSDHCASARLSRRPDGRLVAEIIDNPATMPLFRSATRRLASGLRPAGLMPLAFAARLNGPGSSFHAGASLPMARDPSGNQTDLLGRPAGLSRLHVVDASVLPAIPATTITLPVMANAHRIGALAP